MKEKASTQSSTFDASSNICTKMLKYMTENKLQTFVQKHKIKKEKRNPLTCRHRGTILTAQTPIRKEEKRGTKFSNP